MSDLNADTPATAKPLEQFTLYHRPSCGFCRRVYRALDELDLAINGVDISQNVNAREQLYREGGKTQVPALHIERTDGRAVWMYESLDIIDYLREQVSASQKLG